MVDVLICKPAQGWVSFHVICLTSESHISFLRFFSRNQKCQVFVLSSVFSWHIVKLSSCISKLLELKPVSLKFIKYLEEGNKIGKQLFVWKTGKCLYTLSTGLLLISDLKLFKSILGVHHSSKDENILCLHYIPVRRFENWKMGTKYLSEGIFCILEVG